MNTNVSRRSAAPDGEAAVVLPDLDAPECPVPAGDGGLAQPVVRIREEHNISRRDIDPDALKVLYRLARNNYTAYLVGGGVRDLLLGRRPKDFDISTNAKPEQIRSLFRNCILIGRRFRLAHIRYGDKIIETSTFRRTPQMSGDPNDPDADLFQRDDNLFGSPQEDALRRDFTVNGLFYDIETFSIIDYVGGMEDLAARRIRCIGDPCIRFREDPVRMVRAVRFASRLDFNLDPDTEDAIRKHGSELTKASPARLLEEITRLFAFSAGERAVRLLHSTGLLGVMLPEVSACLDSDQVDHERFWKRLHALDTGDTVMPEATPALIFATLLLDPLKQCLGKEWTSADAPRLKFEKVHAFLEPMAQRLRFPRKLVDRIVHVYLSQHRFAAQTGGGGKRGYIANFVTQESFHESLALAELVLTSEGGSQTRLNQWRDMLAERLFGREDGVQGGGRGGNGNGGRTDDEEIGPRLSRSARRRRNKRMRKQRPDEPRREATATEEDAALPAIQETAATESNEPAAEEAKKPARSRPNRRGGRCRKKDAAEAPAPEQKERREDAGEETVQPLTAAAFYAMPEPEPEPEPEKPKKSRARKPKAEGGRGRARKAKADDAKPAAADNDPAAPLPMDKADEADIPMHWLDEI